MTFVRTVLGDIEPAAMGVTYAHEHLVIVGGKPVEISPDFLLADVDRMARESCATPRSRPPDRGRRDAAPIAGATR